MTVIASCALVAGLFLLPTSRHVESQLDPIGTVLSILAIGGLVAGLIQGPVRGWSSTSVVSFFVISAVTLGGFVAWELRCASPMLDLRLFRDKRFAVGTVGISAAYLALFGLYFLLTQYLQLVRGDSPIRAGLLTLPAGLAQLVVATVTRPFVARWGYRPILFCGLAAGASGLFVMSRLGSTTPLVVCEFGLVLVGTGIGLTMPPATGAILAAVLPHKVGVGSAVNDVVREIGGAIGIALFGSVLAVKFHSAITPHLAIVSPGQRSAARRGLPQALQVAHDAGSTELARQARQAFVDGFGAALAWGAVLVGLLAIFVYWYMPAGLRPTTVGVPRSVPAQVGLGADAREGPWDDRHGR